MTNCSSIGSLGKEWKVRGDDIIDKRILLGPILRRVYLEINLEVLFGPSMNEKGN